MNSRERILAAVNHQPVDRVPTDIWATPEVWSMLQERFGSAQAACEALHIDRIAGAGPAYIGPPAEAPAGQTVDPVWRLRHRSVSHGTGAYNEQCYWPLADARTIEDLEKWDWPSADWFDYKSLREPVLEARKTHAVLVGYMAPFFMHNLLRGLEQSLIDPHDDPDFTVHLLNRICDFLYERHARSFEACEGLIDMAQVTDDYGSQTGPMISLQTFRRFYKPHLQRFMDLCHSFGIKVFHHDDGAIRTFIPDLIDMGVDILNPIQSACPGMDRRPLKEDFGGSLCFHGGIDNQHVLPFGSPDEVRAEVRSAIDELASDNTGYILAPCHNIQPVTPIENIIAMYDEAHNYGRRVGS